jgi:hypothetical protein
MYRPATISVRLCSSLYKPLESIYDRVSLRANIFETVLVPLINEQGEKEKGTYEFSWCCSFSWGFG